ncbi:MAG: prepilin-type N-terminal cleavage/methylation domain-containing protein [Candidatus Thiodiazotropha sp. (ex Dulcina madagascariensis)]|nr:prepilin-type N-terminal cleavage/methylation domain-containing protein [Candidatus Thiodiazotropha sp. (ex Dulcina madagascariensis)]MCU7926702.1 prepilin-type N-terminal cleavage/methylation domain-containing protein [Candidatus Thiodiazotropha sp. (ex Dulcina madagascariensis)]
MKGVLAAVGVEVTAKPFRPARLRGFTLIELMLVLVVLALLVTLTPPLFEKAFPALKLKAAARDLAQEIRYVQQTAILTGRPMQVRFNLQTHAYQSDQVNGGEVRALPEGIRFVTRDGPMPAEDRQRLILVFYPDGSSSGGLLLLDNGGRRFAITVDWLTSRVAVNEHDQFQI